jgi:hypothetical protein
MLYPGGGLLSWPHLNFRLTPPQVTIIVGWYYKQEQTLPRSLLRWFLGLIIVVLKKSKTQCWCITMVLKKLKIIK